MASTSTEYSGKSFGARFLHGTTFLTFEHCLYFGLVVALPFLLLVSVGLLLGLWSGKSDAASETFGWTTVQSDLRMAKTTGTAVLAAALLVLGVKLYVLRRRVSAEYAKRPGYTNRVAYKLPVYTALGVLWAISVGTFISMLGVFLNSLMNIGVSGVSVGDMYLRDFVPALLGFIVSALSGWYVLWFAKGKDASRVFVGVISLLSAATVVALLVTAVTINHDTKTTPTNPIQIQPYPYNDDSNYLPY